MPDEFEPSRLARRTLQIVAVFAVVGLVLLLAPGLGQVRDRLTEARPEWVALAVVFEALSCVSYVLMFRPVFCQSMPWRTSWEIGLAELGAGSIVPGSGAGGLALGAWILSQGGMPGERIARRSVAFFIIKSSVNFVAVAVLGTVMALGLVGPELSPWLTVVPAVGATLVIAAVLVVPRLGVGAPVPADAGRTRRALRAVRKALVGGTREAVEIVRSRNLLVITGAVGYWAWDNAVLWATFHAFDYSPPITVILMGYLIGQLGGLLPITGRPRRHRRRSDRHADRVRHPGGRDHRRGARLPRDPLLAAPARGRRGVHLAAPGVEQTRPAGAVRGAGGHVGHASQPPPLEPAEAARPRVSKHDFIRAASTRLAHQPIDRSPCRCAEYAEFDVAGVRAHHLSGPCQVLAREVAADLIPEHRAGVAAAARHGLLRCEG